MASTFQNANFTELATFLPAPVRSTTCQDIFKANSHRLYALAFWMTDSELAAEELMNRAFVRAFALTENPSAETIDNALVLELCGQIPLGPLTLHEPVCTEVMNVRQNTMRVHLERAIVQVPVTERLIFLLHDVEGYDHTRIARTLGIARQESQFGLHQARIRIRNLVSAMPRLV